MSGKAGVRAATGASAHRQSAKSQRAAQDYGEFSVERSASTYCVRLPPEEERLLTTTLQKPLHGYANTWLPRTAVVSQQSIELSREDSDVVNESMKIENIARVERTSMFQLMLQSAGGSELERPRSNGKPSSPTGKGASNRRRSSISSSSLLGSFGKGNPMYDAMQDNTAKEENIVVIYLKEKNTESSSRTFYRADDAEAADLFLTVVKRAIKAQHNRYTLITRKAKSWYEHFWYQAFMYGVIGFAFVLSLYEAEALPEEGSDAFRFLKGCELSFTIIFTIDLAFNLFTESHSRSSLRLWLNQGWNLFDMLIVIVSWISEFSGNVPGLASLRLLRVFRVVRLVRSMPALRSLINALAGAIEPLVHSFSVVLLVTCIFAVLSTKLFRDRSEVHFGSWSISFYTMLQLATSEGWPDVARSMWKDENTFDPWVSWYFLLYVIIVTTVLMNVAVAVLLDEFLTAVAREKEAKSKTVMEELIEQSPQLQGPLDPLMEAISYFATPPDLTKRIHEIFEVLDVDSSGAIDQEEMTKGLAKLNLRTPILLTQDQWDHITLDGVMLTPSGELSFENFERLIRTQMKEYCYRVLAQSMNQSSESEMHMLFALKLLLADSERPGASSFSFPMSTDQPSLLHPKMKAVEILPRIQSGEGETPSIEQIAPILQTLTSQISFMAHQMNEIQPAIDSLNTQMQSISRKLRTDAAEERNHAMSRKNSTSSLTSDIVIRMQSQRDPAAQVHQKTDPSPFGDANFVSTVKLSPPSISNYSAVSSESRGPQAAEQKLLDRSDSNRSRDSGESGSVGFTNSENIEALPVESLCSVSSRERANQSSNQQDHTEARGDSIPKSGVRKAAAAGASGRPTGPEISLESLSDKPSM